MLTTPTTRQRAAELARKALLEMRELLKESYPEVTALQTVTGFTQAIAEAATRIDRDDKGIPCEPDIASTEMLMGFALGIGSLMAQIPDQNDRSAVLIELGRCIARGQANGRPGLQQETEHELRWPKISTKPE